MIGVRPVLISSDHRPGAALDNRTGGGGFPHIEESTGKDSGIRKREWNFL